MAKENPSLGYFRIRGELLKLGHTAAATTIRSVLVRAGVPPSPHRAGMSWKQFLAAHAQTLVAADFLSVDTVFFKRLYVLIYMHLASRRVLLPRVVDLALSALSVGLRQLNTSPAPASDIQAHHL